MLADAQTIENDNKTENDNEVERTEPISLLLELTSSTMKESWEILLLLKDLWCYDIEPDRIWEHWKRQSELQYELVSNWSHHDHNDDDGYQDGIAFANFYRFMVNEISFLSAFQKLLQERCVKTTINELQYDDFFNLYRHVLQTQAEIVERIGTAVQFFEYLPDLEYSVEESRVEDSQLTT